jgi:hypothetical protein
MRRHASGSEPLGIRGYRLISRPAIWPLPNAAGAGPAFPAIQHQAELAGGDGRSLAGVRDLVGVGRRVGTEPIRLGVLTPAARLSSPFAGDVGASEIAGRKCNPEQQNQYDDSDCHSELRLTPRVTFCQHPAGGQGLTCSIASQCPEASSGKAVARGRICRFHVRCCSAFATPISRGGCVPSPRNRHRTGLTFAPLGRINRPANMTGRTR